MTSSSDQITSSRGSILMTSPAPTSDFVLLRRLVKDQDLLDLRPWAYARTSVCVVGAFALAWTGFFLLGASWWQLGVAAVLGLVFTQLGFLGHDAGHHQVSRSAVTSTAIGLLVGNLAIGLGTGWWNDKHSAHHAHPNHQDHDPDVQPGAVVWAGHQAVRRTGLARILTRWQGFLYLPMLTLEGLSLHVASLRATRRRDGSVRWLELLLLSTHLICYVGFIVWILPLGQALAFIAVQQATFGLYLGLSFAPNHKGMPILTDEDMLTIDHLRSQVLTSRNVRPGPLVDRLLGGLNYQIEHHLFPAMPRANLRHARPMVQAFCLSKDVPYTETGLLHSYVLGLRHLRTVGEAVRPSVVTGVT